MMKIALIGYGKMGKAIESIALSRGNQVVCTIDNSQDWETKHGELKEADVAIEFSLPEFVLDNIYKCFEIDLPVVVGTTGWHQHIEKVKTDCIKGEHKLIFATNFSIGVNIFFNLNQQLAKMMNEYAEYSVSMDEIHHTQKLDAPSGTAISLAQDAIEEIERLEDWKKEEQEKESDLAIRSHRIAQTIGTHWLTYESDIDKIEIKHEAKNRNGFAGGAVLAAEKISEIKGFWEFKDLLF